MSSRLWGWGDWKVFEFRRNSLSTREKSGCFSLFFSQQDVRLDPRESVLWDLLGKPVRFLGCQRTALVMNGGVNNKLLENVTVINPRLNTTLFI